MRIEFSSIVNHMSCLSFNIELNIDIVDWSVFPCYFVSPLSNLLVWTTLEGVFPFHFMLIIFLKLLCFLGKLGVMRKGCWYCSLTGYGLFLPLVPSFVKYELANLATVHLKSAICLKTLGWKAEHLANSFNFCSL